MSLFPGTMAPESAPLTTLDGDGFLEARFAFTTHTGTHLDAPSHILPDGLSLSRLPVDRFFGPAICLDLRGAPGEEGVLLTPDRLAPHLHRLAEKEFVLLLTGWGAKWGANSYLSGWPALTPEAAHLLAMFPLKGVGVDALSVDGAGSRELPVHRILLGVGMVVVENLAGLDSLPRPDFTFCCLPLPLAEGDGSPVRAVAIL